MERKTQMLLVGGFILLVFLAVGAAAFFSGDAAVSNFTATTVPQITPADHVRGDTSARVTVIEYGDFECPACGAWEPLMAQLEQTYGNRVEFVFRNFPLYNIHPFAMIGAYAAEAAANQGQYWQMHDLLYREQTAWTANGSLTPADVVSQFFNGYAQQLGLNVAEFDADINASTTAARVQQDLASGNAAKIDHTPTFFVNLTQIQNPTGLAQFEQLLNQQLATSSGATPTGK